MFKSERTTVELHLLKQHKRLSIKLDQIEQLESTWLNLGAGHKQHQVKASQFNYMETALIHALEYVWREKCNDKVIQAWSNYIDFISGIMIKGLTADKA